MDSIRVSEALDPRSIRGEATIIKLPTALLLTTLLIVGYNNLWKTELFSSWYSSKKPIIPAIIPF
jgi:hypothetical protein